LEIGILLAISLGLLQTVILLISASQVSSIKGMSHWPIRLHHL
jgi:hypothetical protein